jgi:hypothetical protein
MRCTLGGLPLFFLTPSDDDGTVVDSAPDFLFLLPLGRPRLLLGATSLGSVAPARGRPGLKNDQHVELKVSETDKATTSSPSTAGSAF